jgi:hypothetical protein
MSQLLLLAPKLELRRESWGVPSSSLGKAYFIFRAKLIFNERDITSKPDNQ